MDRIPEEISPYNLLQEQLRHDPWKLLVSCIMLNQTTAVQVKKVIWEFFERWPTAEKLCELQDKQELVELIKPLGFQNRRANRLVNMSWSYRLYRPDQNVEQVDLLHGVGKYAADSFRMFIGGYLVHDAQDKELKNYLRWAKGIAREGPVPDVGGAGRAVGSSVQVPPETSVEVREEIAARKSPGPG
jgi:endonuclease III-like uncharacterized protein